MPSRKQRRRRQKERRHEYEYVYVDDEGQEVDPGEVDQEAASTERKKAPPAKAGRKQPTARRGTGARPVPAPSWRRVGRRAAIFAPFMFVAIWLLGHNRLTTTAIVLQTVWLLALFVPFSYVIDRMMYRRYVRQTGQSSPPPERQRRA